MALLANPSASLLYSRGICPKRSDIPLSSSHRVLSFTAEKYGSLAPSVLPALMLMKMKMKMMMMMSVRWIPAGRSARSLFVRVCLNTLAALRTPQHCLSSHQRVSPSRRVYRLDCVVPTLTTAVLSRRKFLTQRKILFCTPGISARRRRSTSCGTLSKAAVMS